MNKTLQTHPLIPPILIYSPLVAQARTDQRYAALMEKAKSQLRLTRQKTEMSLVR
jgi:hypothetical protein